MLWPPWNSGEPFSTESELTSLEVKVEDRMKQLVELLPTEQREGVDDEDQHA